MPSFSRDPRAGCGLVRGNKSGLAIPGEREAHPEHAESPPPELQGRGDQGSLPGLPGEPGHAAAGGWASITDTGAGARRDRDGEAATGRETGAWGEGPAVEGGVSVGP